MQLVEGFLHMNNAQTNNLIRQFGDEKRWVNWSYKTTPDGKKTKVPVGKSNDSTTWSTYQNLQNHDNIGIMFGTDNTFLGVDIDHCVDIATRKVTHDKREEILQFIKEADTYTELSPSKSGLHLYFKLSEPLKLTSNKKAPYEYYSALRFFTVTGDEVSKNKEVRMITKEEALRLLSIIGYEEKEEVPQKQINAISKESITYDEKEILQKMFGSRNGEKIRLLYNGDTTQYGNDDSNADAGLCAHLAFWTQKDPELIESMWKNSPLGQRKKTQERQDYRKRTVEHAIANCKEVYTPVTKTKVFMDINEDEKEEIEFDFLQSLKGKKFVPSLCVENIVEVLRKHPQFKGTLRKDEFTGKGEIKEKGKWRQFVDVDAIVIQTKISRLFDDFQLVSKGMVFDAIDFMFLENRYDSVKDFLTALTWDGAPRLDTWLCDAYGVEDNIYHRAVASNWMKGMVKRMMYPGCKFDYVLVLEGEQGRKKSTSLNVLGGQWYLETVMDTNTKDFFMQFYGKAIVEFSEGETLSRTEVKRMKAIITTQVDTFRAPYERAMQDHPRRCVFAMTTNTSEYLKDETGNRRWLPVETKRESDIEWIEKNREQLFAEAYHRAITLKETVWEFPEEETREQQNTRRISDPNEQVVVDWYLSLPQYKKQEGVTTLNAFVEGFNNNMGSKKMSRSDEMSIANVFKDTLRLVKQRNMRDGIRMYRWYPEGHVQELIESPFEISEKEVEQDF